MRAILFDVDGVLADSFQANLKFFNDLFLVSGHPPFTSEQYARLFHKTFKDVLKMIVGNNWKNLNSLAQSDAMIYDTSLISMDPDAEAVLKSLHEQFILGIVSSREDVFEIPELARLKNYFSVVIMFSDTENHKPHPEPLLLASKRLDIPPEECVYVGDSKSDEEAALSAGMQFVLFDIRKDRLKDLALQFTISGLR